MNIAQKDFGYELRRLLLRRLKDYYQPMIEKIIPDNEYNEGLLNMIANNEDVALDNGYLPIFGENELSQVFYNYKTSESFIAIMTDRGYAYLENSYSIINSFSSNIALNVGLCYKIFEKEKHVVEDEDLASCLDREAFRIEQLIQTQNKLAK